VVPTLVNLADRNGNRCRNLGIAQNSLGNSPRLHPDFGLVDVFFNHLAGTDSAQWKLGQLLE
jgi:hypothetical protein